MEDRADDLFVLDAEQAARELLIYGDGQSDLPFDRISNTVDYLAPLLQSCSLLRHADACMLLLKLLEQGDEGQVRRSLREFSELTLKALEALRTGVNDPTNEFNEALERLIARLDRFAPANGQHQAAGPTLRLAKVEGAPFDPDRELIANAFRAIEAVDSLAVMIAQEAHSQAEQVSEADRATGTDSLHASAKDLSGAAAAMEDSTQADHESLEPQDMVAQVDEPVKPEGQPSEWASSTWPADALVLPSDSGNAEPVASAPPLPSKTDTPGGREVSSTEIDAVIRKAMRLAKDGPWAPGMTALLEAIDVLDHVNLRDWLPRDIKLLAGTEVLVAPDVARTLAHEFKQLRLSGVADAMLVSHTLILAIQLEDMVLSDRLAKQMAWYGGRIEVDTALKRWRIVVPASSRLLRVTQLKADGVWIAVPWAQFMGLEGRVPRQEAQLRIGNEPDRIRIDAVDLVSTGVRFELPKQLRKRERYRGLVMLANGQCLPVYA